MKETRNAYRISVGGESSLGKPFGTARSRWEDNINIDLTEIRYEDVI